MSGENERRELIEALEARIGDSRRGLPEDVFLFVSRLTPLVNVDLLVQDDRSRTLLTWRDDEFFATGWHVPGGIIRYKETMADRIRACARDELGATVAWDDVPVLVTENRMRQASRGHFISLLVRCRLLSGPAEDKRAVSDSPNAGEWRWHDGCPPDIIDVHKQYARFF